MDPGYVYDGLLDDSQIRGGGYDPEEDLNNETFGGGLEDGGTWENNQAQFERIREQDLAQLPHHAGRPDLEGRPGEIRSDNDLFNRTPMPSSFSKPGHELRTPNFFQTDDDRDHELTQNLQHLMDDDDGPTTSTDDMSNGPDLINGAAATSPARNPWVVSAMQPAGMPATGPSSVTSSLGKMDLGMRMTSSPVREPRVAQHPRTTAEEAGFSVENLFASANSRQHHQSARSGGNVGLGALLGSARSTSSTSTPPTARGLRLEDIESGLRTDSSTSPTAGTPTNGARAGQPHAPEPGQSSRSWVEHLQFLQPTSGPNSRAGTPEGPPRAGIDGMPMRPPMLPPRPGVLPPGMPRPPLPGAGPLPGLPRPEVRPGFLPAMPPNVPPPVPSGFRGMQPLPWVYGHPPPAGQRMPDMMRYPMPPGMRPPGPPPGDPNWRGPPVPPNFRPPMMHMGHMPGPNMPGHGPAPPKAGPLAPHHHRQAQQDQNTMNYPFVFMTNREKDWILKVQLIQLSKFSSYLDDYYYLSYRRRHPSHQPMLGLPRLDEELEIKPENPHGRITVFEGALGGRISTGSVHCPRQTLMISDPISAATSKVDPENQASTLHKRRVFLHAIETAYDKLLALDDIGREQHPEGDWPQYRQVAISKVFGCAKVRSWQDRFSGTRANASDDYSLSFLSIAKGAQLIVRLAPLLSTEDVQSLVGLFCYHLVTFMKRDEDKIIVKVLLSGFQDILQRLPLAVLTCLLELLNRQPVYGSVAAVALLVEQYTAAAVAFLGKLVKSGYRQCMVADSPKSLAVVQWQQRCHFLAELLRPHHAALLESLPQADQVGFRDFVLLLAQCAEGRFSST